MKTTKTKRRKAPPRRPDFRLPPDSYWLERNITVAIVEQLTGRIVLRGPKINACEAECLIGEDGLQNTGLDVLWLALKLIPDPGLETDEMKWDEYEWVRDRSKRWAEAEAKQAEALKGAGI